MTVRVIFNLIGSQKALTDALKDPHLGTRRAVAEAIPQNGQGR